jgi:hypothetical protein
MVPIRGKGTNCRRAVRRLAVTDGVITAVAAVHCRNVRPKQQLAENLILK